MYKKLGNYNNYSNVKEIDAPIIAVNNKDKGNNPSYIFNSYGNPKGNPNASCDNIIIRMDKNGVIQTLEPGESSLYYSEKDTLSKMKCTVDPNTNFGSIKCYDYMSGDPQQCCPSFSNDDDTPIILGAVSSEYERVHKALQKSNPNSVTAKNVDRPQCVNLNQNTPPPHNSCCGIKNSKGCVYHEKDCDCAGKWDSNAKPKPKCQCDTGFQGDNCEAVVPIKDIKSLKVPHHMGYDGYNGCASLVVCPYGLERLVPSKAGDYWETGCLHGQIPTKLDVFGDYKNCYVIHQNKSYGPDCEFRGYSKAGTEYDIKVQQNFCFGEAGNITTTATNYKSEEGSWWDGYGGGIVIGPKIVV